MFSRFFINSFIIFVLFLIGKVYAIGSGDIENINTGEFLMSVDSGDEEDDTINTDGDESDEEWMWPNEDLADVKVSEIPFRPYASSYLPKQDGPLTEWKTVYDNKFLKERKARSNAKRFDEARKAVIGDDSVSLEKIFLARGYRGKLAHDWEGFCHQWSAAAIDPKVSEMLEGTKDTGGLVCGPVVLRKADLEELFTATYYSFHEKKNYWGVRNLRNDRQSAEINSLDDDLRLSLGQTTFKPHEYVKVAHRNLDAGKGLVIDAERSGEVWNQPVYRLKTEIYQLSDEEMSNFSTDGPFEGAVLDVKYYVPKNHEARASLNRVNEITKAQVALRRKLNKDKDDRVSKIIKNKVSKPFRSEIERIEDTKKLRLVGLVEYLLQEKAKAYQKAVEAGISLDPKYVYKRGESITSYRKETNYAEEVNDDDPDCFKDDPYHYIVIEDRNGQVVDSRWVSYARPDFAWEPVVQSKTCHQKAAQFKKSIFLSTTRLLLDKRHHKALTIGLSDLLKLFDKCTPLNKATQMVQEMFDDLDMIISGEKSVSGARNDIMAAYNRIQKLKIPFNEDLLIEKASQIRGAKYKKKGLFNSAKFKI